MNLSIKAFGIARDFLGEGITTFIVKDGTTIHVFKRALAKDYPDFEKIKSYAIAVNQEYKEDGYIIREGDEVAIIPPVSGG
ncbi:MAG: MoaD/ThiS family protein [Saprospiraceae bacterium]